MVLQMIDDRAGRGDGELLARDLEDERRERVERRKLLEPRPRPEVRPRVDHLRKHRVGFPQKLTGGGIGRDAHSWILPLLNPQPSRAYAKRRSVHRAPTPR